MNTINYKFSPGDKVFGVNFYPIGAKIFEGTVIEAVLKVSANSKFVGYKISSRPIAYFPEENIFSSEDEAKKAREDWLNNIKDKQHEEDFNTPSMLPYNDDRASTTTERLSIICRWNS